MSVHTPSVGIDHPTVVPANFDPDRSEAHGSNDAETTTGASRDDGSTER